MEGMATKAKCIKGCKIRAENDNVKHIKACTFQATDPERPKNPAKM